MNVAACPDRELADGRRFPAERIRHLAERHTEHVVEEEGRSLQRRQALERHHQRQSEVIPFETIILGIDQRFGQPGAHITLAAEACRLHLVEAKPGDDAREVRIGSRDIPPVPGNPAQPCVLHDVLRFAA